MSHPLHHSISSQKQWGGSVNDYLPIHNWFDTTRVFYRDMRHRAMRHHLEGFAWCEQEFGICFMNSDGAEVPTKSICEQHCVEDEGFVPTIKDYLDHLPIAGLYSAFGKERKIKSDKIEYLCGNSQKKWGGQPEDYFPIHNWFNSTTGLYPDARHLVLRHHIEGVFWCESLLGTYIINSDKRMVPVREIGEQHCLEVIGSVPYLRDYLQIMPVINWMYNPGKSRAVMKDIRQNKLDYLQK